MAGESFDDFEREYNARRATAIAAMSPLWGIRGYRAHNTRDGVAYVFRLTRHGIVVAHVEDSGRGGAPMIDWLNRDGVAARTFDAESHALFGEGWVQDDMIDAILTREGK